MTQRRELDSAQFSLEGLLQPGDTVVCGQVCAAPLTLTRRLVSDAGRMAMPLQVFVGTLFSDL